MLLVLELDVADLAATRFAISPLSETVRAVQLLAQRETPAVNAPWVRWARSELGWRPLLEADIAYRAGLLADGGARSLFSDLHRDLRWSGGMLTLTGTDQGPPVFKIMLGPDGVVLMPSVFNWPQVSLSRATSTQTIMLYPARGAATVWEGGAWAGSAWAGGAWAGEGGGREEAAVALLGAPRVRLLTALRSPATTTAPARRLGVTPSAVSQHLAVLHRGGLVDKRRSGRAVLYRTTALGLALLGDGSASSRASAS